MTRTFTDDLPVTDDAFRFPLSEVPMPNLEWTTRAACRRTDLEGKELQRYVALFFPRACDPVPKEILDLCKTCPVFAECEAFSMRWRVGGIWAGRREEVRNRMRRAQRRRPKEAA